VELGSNATVYVAGISDAAGNIVVSNTSTVSVTKDTTALSVSSVQQVSNQKVRVIFNKKLSTASDTAIKAGTGLVVSKANGSTTTSFSVAAAPSAVDPDGKAYDITLSEATYATSNTETFTLTLVKDAFTDVTNNKNNLYSQSLTLTKDTVAPTIASAALASNGEAIEVTMSEDVATASPTVKLRKDGAELTGVTATLKSGTQNVYLVTNTAAGTKLSSGSYQVRIESGQVTDLNGNTNGAVNSPVVNVSATPAAPLEATVATTATNTFTVTAPAGETFTTASLNASNFRIDGQPVSSNSDITLNAGRNVITVVLPTENTVAISGPALFTTNGLALESGKALANASKTVTVTDNTAAVLQSASLVGNNVIKLSFNENIAATFVDIADILDDVVISNGTATFAETAVASGAVDATATYSVSGKDLVITVTPNDSNGLQLQVLQM
jgi:hypothetical protein